jgi:hypothetical protein
MAAFLKYGLSGESAAAPRCCRGAVMYTTLGVCRRLADAMPDRRDADTSYYAMQETQQSARANKDEWREIMDLLYFLKTRTGALLHLIGST